MKKRKKEKTKVAIIGAGPAGISAAFCLNRFGIPCLVLEKDRIGGLARHANLVENNPLFPPAKGWEVVGKLERAARKNKIRILFEKVEKTGYSGGRFNVETKKTIVRSDFLVVASGTRPGDAGFPEKLGEDRVIVDCPAYFKKLRGKRIAVVGGGDAAFDYALNFARKNRVFLLNRSRRVKGLKLLFDRAARCPGIAYFGGTKIAGAGREGGLLKLKCRAKKSFFYLNADYLVPAVGRTAEVSFMGGLSGRAGALKRRGRLLFAGDVKNGIDRQILLAAADGMKAAMKIRRSA